MSSLPDMNPLIDAIPGRTLPARANYASLALIGLGVLGFGYGMGVAGAAYTWGALLVSILFFLGVSQGGVLFAAMLTGTHGRWGRPLKRVGETMGFFLPVAYLALLVFLVAGSGIYPWSSHPLLRDAPMSLAPHSAAATASKELWYNPAFWMGRQVVGFLVLIGIDLVYIRASLRPDLLKAKGRLGDRAPKWWDTVIGRHGDVRSETDASQNGQSNLFVFVALAYVVVFSLMAMDLVMGLDPWWYANMMPAWMFMSSFWISLCTLGVVTMVGLDWLKLRPFVAPNVTHDLGKLCLALCMFWAYTSYAQLLAIYYGNMTEETTFLLLRLQHPAWQPLATFVGALCFVTPFTIFVSRGVKKMRWPFAAACSVPLVGIFLERSLLVVPAVHLGDSFPLVSFLLVNVTIWLGFWGAFIQVVGRALASVPPLVVSDPYLEPHPWDQHVHALDHETHAS